MSDLIEQNQAEMPEGSQAEPQLADDGIGITLEEARSLLVMKYEQLTGRPIAIGLDDPVLMQVTLLNAFLNVIEKQHKRHESAMQSLLNEETAKYQQMLAATFQSNQTGQFGRKATTTVEPEIAEQVPPPTFFDRFGVLGFIGLCVVSIVAAIWLANMVWSLK